MKPTEKEQRIEILRFMSEKKVTLHPLAAGPHFDDKVAKMVKDGHCVCLWGRKACPCPEAVDEIAADGHCGCSVFSTYEDASAYLTTYGYRSGVGLVANAKKKKGGKGDVKKEGEGP